MAKGYIDFSEHVAVYRFARNPSLILDYLLQVAAYSYLCYCIQRTDNAKSFSFFSIKFHLWEAKFIVSEQKYYRVPVPPTTDNNAIMMLLRHIEFRFIQRSSASVCMCVAVGVRGPADNVYRPKFFSHSLPTRALRVCMSINVDVVVVVVRQLFISAINA